MKTSFMKLVSRLLIVCTLAFPFHSQAGMISTDQVASTVAHDQDTRGRISDFLSRSEVQSQLQAAGIDAGLAKDRVAAMTDEEVVRMAGQIDSLPAGGYSAWAVAVLIGLIIWAWYAWK